MVPARTMDLLSPLRTGMHIRPSPETFMPVCLGTNAELVPMSSLFLSSPSPQSISRSPWLYPTSSFQLVSISMQPWGWRLGAFYTRGKSISIFVFLSPEIVGWCWSACTSSSFEMVFGQKMRRHRVWKTSSLVVMAYVTFQDSAPYRKTPGTSTMKKTKNLKMIFFYNYM